MATLKNLGLDTGVFPLFLDIFPVITRSKRLLSNRITNAKGHQANAARCPFSFLRAIK